MKNMHVFMAIISAMVLLVHVGFFLIMHNAGIHALAKFNIFSIVTYVCCTFMFSRKKILAAAYALFFIEIFLFSSITTWTIRDFCGFSTIVSPLIPLVGLLGFMYKVHNNRRNRVFILTLIILSGVFALNTLKGYLWADYGIYDINNDFRQILCIYCCVIECSCVGLMSYVFCSVADSNNDDQNFKIEQLSLKLFVTLSQTVEAKDLYTNGHSMRVAAYSEMIAARMNFSVEEQKKIYYCGLLHDIGKISIADEIINKNGSLTDEEYQEIKKHPVSGWNILHTIDEFPELAQVARWHHERYDGRGYPDGKAGSEVPLYVRIVSIADAYDAMTSNRSYRSVMERSKVIRIIREESGKQFDPEVAEVFLKILEKDKNYEMREKNSLFK